MTGLGDDPWAPFSTSSVKSDGAFANNWVKVTAFNQNPFPSKIVATAVSREVGYLADLIG